MRGRLKTGDGPLGDLGGGDQLRDRGLQRLLVRLEPLQSVVEDDAIGDREQEQDRNQTLDHESEAVGHWASIRVVVPSAFSNIASVILGRRKGLATRTAMRSPTRPMRPSVRVTSPHRTLILASALMPKSRVSPSLRLINCFNGSFAS